MTSAGVLSLVMTDFNGHLHALEAAGKAAFGPRGIPSVFSLAFDRQGRHLPAEIATGLTHEDAARLSSLFNEAGAAVVAVPTAEIDSGSFAVKRRRAELWPTRTASNGWGFTEVAGMDLIVSPLNARDNAAYALQCTPNRPRWEVERGLNHMHPVHGFGRAGQREVRMIGRDLTLALQEQYPDCGFVLEYRDDLISFYQRGEGAEERDMPPDSTELLPEAFCEQCQCHRPYTLRASPDPEFPHADWSDCAVCGTELLLRTWEIREVIGPAPAP